MLTSKTCGRVAVLFGLVAAAAPAAPAVAADPPRPDHRSPVHYRPAQGNFADPVPFFWKGTYHVFYLRGDTAKVPWEHIASKDLVHWEELPTALVSDGPADGFDGEHMFTGSVVEHGGTFHLYYTGWNPRNPKGREFVVHATSPDLLKWTKHPGHAFPPDGKVYANKQDSDFRDPFVFREAPTGRWQMLLCARAAPDNRPVTGVYSSADLVTWRPEAPLCDGYKGTPECPDLFRLGERTYLVVSPSDNVTTYRTADRLAGPWSAGPGRPLDTPIWYAAKSQFDGKRHVVTGWLRDLEGDSDGGAFRWGGTQSIPRELFAGPAGELLSRPVPEARAAYAVAALDLANRPKVVNLTAAGEPSDAPGPWRYEGGRLVGDGAALTRARVAVPADYHLSLAVKLTGPAATFALALRQKDQPSSHYRLEVRPSRGEATLAGPKSDAVRPVPFAAGEDVRIEAFVQGSLIECFVNGGHAFSGRAYGNPDGTLDLLVTGGKAEVREFAVRTAAPAPRSDGRGPAWPVGPARPRVKRPAPTTAGEHSWPSCKSTRPSAARRSRSPRPRARR